MKEKCEEKIGANRGIASIAHLEVILSFGPGTF